MRTAAKISYIFGLILLIIALLFQAFSLFAVLVIEGNPAEVFDSPWLIPTWVVSLALLLVATILCKALQEKPRGLLLPLLLGGVGTVLSLIVALALKEGLPPSINQLGTEQGLTAWKLTYRHLSSVFAGALVVLSAALHMAACREDRLRRENEAYKSVYNLDGAPLFKDDSTLDLEPVEEIAVKPARKVKRSLRHKQQKQ
ncbi:MAG: hypothetical protein IJO76_02360 [Clostridia bacterium]|nr:hypothetical protein [Clostridia bacterium]